MGKLEYRPIGVIHSSLTQRGRGPIQGVYGPENRGTVEVFPEHAEGLKDLEGFSHLFLLYHFDRADGVGLAARPFLDDSDKGVFATRHFNRPNPIGLSVVRLEAVKGCTLEVSELDVLDGTPLLDIKPYVPEFDVREGARAGWLETASLRDKGKLGDGGG